MFTSEQRAEALVGDLLEEGTTTTVHFWFYLVQTIARLIYADVALLSHKPILFFFAALVGQVAVVSVSPFLNGVPGWTPTTHELEWCISLAILGEIASPLFVGLVVAGLSREHESAVCVAMAGVVTSALLLYWIVVAGIAESTMPLPQYLLINCPAPISLVAAGVFLRKRRLRDPAIRR